MKNIKGISGKKCVQAHSYKNIKGYSAKNMFKRIHIKYKRIFGEKCVQTHSYKI
jgi:hypothetical protein